MSRIESTIQVSKSIEDLFNFLSKRESHLNFIPRMIELRQTSQGEFGRVGATANGLLNYFGIRIPVQYEIIDVETNRKLAMRGQMGPVAFRDGYILNGNDKNSKLTFWLELNPTGWTKIFAPFAGLIGRIHAWETLRNLKRALQTWEV